MFEKNPFCVFHIRNGSVNVKIPKNLKQKLFLRFHTVWLIFDGLARTKVNLKLTYQIQKYFRLGLLGPRAIF
jgi:ribosome-associated toxin RatA of RatAB toxin-antitoxin module